MPRNGLTKERIIEAAAEFIDRFGAEDFSMRALADSLNIRAASLYNHIESMDELMAEVFVYALKMQWEAEMCAIETQIGAQAIQALAFASRRFSKEHRALYRLIANTASLCGNRSDEISRYIPEPFMRALDCTSLTDTEKIHWQRVLRGMIHGFAAQEDAGFFAHLPEDVDQSFQTAIQCYIDGLTQAEMRKRT